MASTDAAMELLEQVQHDLGEGPYLQAFSQDRAVGVEDLRTVAARTRSRRWSASCMSAGS